MNTNCILITAYCDTEEKRNILYNCISHLKENYKEFDILLYSHYPMYFYDECDYYIYDSSNPVISSDENAIINWYDITEFVGTPTKAITILPDAGYAVLSMWQKGTSYLKSHGYENSIIITYDSYVYDDNFKNFLYNGLSKINSYDCIMQKYLDNAYSMNYAILKLSEFTSKICPIINKNKYLSYKNSMAEYIIYNMMKENNMNVYLDDTLKERNLIHSGRYNDIGVDSISMFWFGQNYEGKPTIVIYDNDNKNIKIQIKVNEFTVFDAEGTKNFIVYTLPVDWYVIEYLKVVEYCGNKIYSVAYSDINSNFIKNNKFVGE